ncbi:MAG: flagellar hook-associated protein FlgK [Phycisphaerales bacterium]|nr:flagellar hook-associated protein FlgK [Phycisphaerales bacterium]
MSINGALQIGRSAMTASQAAIQVTGNNMANAATPGYARRTVHFGSARDEMSSSSHYIGTGVNLLDVRREVDGALQSRLRNAISDERASIVDQRYLTAIEILQNETTDNDISSRLSAFFNAFSELANNPEENAVRSVVVQEAIGLASSLAGLRQDYGTVRAQIDESLGQATRQVNELLDQIAAINMQIAQSETANSRANALRDQRDRIIDEVSTYLDITAREQANGVTDVFVGSLPIVLAGSSRGIELRPESTTTGVDYTLRIRDDGSLLDPRSGELGALLRQRNDTVQPALEDLDTLAANLIFELNRLHAQGQPKTLQNAFTGTYQVTDTTVPLNDASSGTSFDIDNGGFFVHIRNTSTGIMDSYRIDVNGATDSLDDLIAEINVNVGVPNLTAGVTSDGSFTLTAGSGYAISFSEDTSGALAALGVNTFFVGSTALDIDVHADIQANPNYIAAGGGNINGSNDTAVAIANLQDVPVDALNGMSLRGFWLQSVNALAASTGSANRDVASSALVRESLAAQLSAVSGVSLDEESMNLLTFERQFQAAARFISVIDEQIQTLLSLV